jgi:DNA-directed RNA polymerase specialized sigma24 family protein
MSKADAEELIERILGGDDGAWSRLWQLVEPRLYATLRRPYFLGPLSQREDDCRNVVLQVMERLKAGDYARLRTFMAARREKPGLVFMAWLLVVAKRVAIDYMRSHEEYVDRRHEVGASRPGAWRVIDSWVADSRAPGARPSITAEATAHEILARAGFLPPLQQRTLAAWLAGRTWAEIAAEEGLASERDAEKALRAALASLRRQFPREEEQS